MKAPSLILFILLAINASAAPIAVDRDFRSIALGTHIEYLPDPASILTIDDIRGSAQMDRDGRPLRWLRSNNDALGFGFTTATYWVRFKIANTAGSTVECYLNQNYPLISHIEFHGDDGTVLTSITTGHRYGFSQRPMNYRTFVFPITIKPHREVTCYMRYRSESALIIDLDLYAPPVFKTRDSRENAVFWMFYGVLLIMFLYHLFLLFSMKDVGYLYYILSIVSMLFLAMGLNGVSYQYLWPEHTWWERYNNPLMIGLTYAFFLQFARYYINLKQQMPRADLAIRILMSLSLFAGLSTFIVHNFRISIITTTAITLVSMFYNIYVLMALAIVKKSRPARSFLAATGLLMPGVILYILKTYGIIPDNVITSYSMLAGWVAMVILLSLGLADRINAMRTAVEEAQKKYLQVLDRSNDIIFNLDGQFRFATVNRAIKKHLGYEPGEVLSTAFFDYIDRVVEKEGDMFRQIYEEYLMDLGKEKNSLSFRGDFMPKYGGEPVSLSVKLDYVRSDGKANIFGTASPVTDDIILDLMDEERQVYCTDNSLSNAELLCQRLIKNLGKYLDQSGIQIVKTGLLEVIINAIEHGNLGIQFSEKSGSVAGHEYLEFIRERRKDPRYRDRRVRIEYSLSSSMVAYRITDEGEGFDHRSIMELSPDSVNRDLLTHGRGLLIVRKSFDTVTFNEKGNQVTLVKYFHGRSGEEPQF